MPLERHIVELTAKDSISPALQKIGLAAKAAGASAEQGAQKAARATAEWDKQTDKVDDSIKRMGNTAKIAGTGLALVFGVTVKAASGLAETMDKSKRTFGDGFDDIEQFADGAATALGLSKQQALDAASAFGLMFKSAGASADDVAGMSTAVVKLGADLGSLYNVGSEEAQQALISGLVGESEPLRKFNIFLNETVVNQELMRQGAVKVSGQYTDQQKVMARYNLIMAQSGDANNNFIETSDGLANSAKTAHAELANAAATLGTSFLPAAVMGAHGISELASAFQSLPSEAQSAIGGVVLAVGGLAVLGVGAVKVAELAGDLKNLALVAKETKVAMGAMNLASAVGPWAGLALGVGLAAGAIYYLTTRESESEKQVKALDQATAAYTQTIIDQTTALANLGLLDEAEAMKTYLDAISKGGQVAQERIDTVVKAIEEIPGAGVNLEGLGILFGDLDQAQKDYIVTQLESNNYFKDQVITAAELSAILPMLAKGFELNTTQATALDNAMIDVTKAMADPALFGQAMGDRASVILQQMRDDVITVDEAITMLIALPIDQAFNRAAVAAAALVPPTDALTESLYGGVAAIGDSNLKLKSYEEVLADAQAATEAQTKAAIDLAKANSRAGWDKMNEGALKFQEQVDASALASKQLSDELDALAVSLEYNAGGAAAAAYERVVGLTSGITASIQTTKDWADALLLPVEGLSIMDDLLARGIIESTDYEEVLKAQVQTTDALAESTDAMNEIQVKQASVLADGAMASADYLQNIAKLDEAEQSLALAWADTDIAGRANEIAGMASQFGNMDVAQKAAFENMVLAAAATDPALAGVLEDLGLITDKVGAPGEYELAIDESEATASLQDVVDAIDALIRAITGIPDATVDVNANTEPYFRGIDGIPEKAGDSFVDVWERWHGFGPHALGGMIPYAETAALGRVSGGNMTLVGEHGPELVKLNGGDMVIPNHASRYMDSGKGGGGITFNGPITVIANNPEQFMQQMRSYTSSMERR